MTTFLTYLYSGYSMIAFAAAALVIGAANHIQW